MSGRAFYHSISPFTPLHTEKDLSFSSLYFRVAFSDHIYYRVADRSEETTAVGELFIVIIPHVSTVENRKSWKNRTEIIIIIHKIQKLQPLHNQETELGGIFF